MAYIIPSLNNNSMDFQATANGNIPLLAAPTLSCGSELPFSDDFNSLMAETDNDIVPDHIWNTLNNFVPSMCLSNSTFVPAPLDLDNVEVPMLVSPIPPIAFQNNFGNPIAVHEFSSGWPMSQNGQDYMGNYIHASAFNPSQANFPSSSSGFTTAGSFDHRVSGPANTFIPWRPDNTAGYLPVLPPLVPQQISHSLPRDVICTDGHIPGNTPNEEEVPAPPKRRQRATTARKPREKKEPSTRKPRAKKEPRAKPAPSTRRPRSKKVPSQSPTINGAVIGNQTAAPTIVPDTTAGLSATTYEMVRQIEETWPRNTGQTHYTAILDFIQSNLKIIPWEDVEWVGDYLRERGTPPVYMAQWVILLLCHRASQVKQESEKEENGEENGED